MPHEVSCPYTLDKSISNSNYWYVIYNFIHLLLKVHMKANIAELDRRLIWFCTVWRYSIKWKLGLYVFKNNRGPDQPHTKTRYVSRYHFRNASLKSAPAVRLDRTVKPLHVASLDILLKPLIRLHTVHYAVWSVYLLIA